MRKEAEECPVEKGAALGYPGENTAALFLTGRNGRYEVFGSGFAAEVFQETAFQELLRSALSQCKSLGAQTLTYFCDEQARPVLNALGFRCVGQYALYAKKTGAG